MRWYLSHMWVKDLTGLIVIVLLGVFLSWGGAVVLGVIWIVLVLGRAVAKRRSRVR